jgi:hypothetical protein
MTDDNPRAFVAAYSQATTDLVIPLAALKQAEAELDAARERRRVEVEENARLVETARKPWWERLRAWLRRR